MTNSTGFGENAAQAAIENITNGGITVHLMTSAVDYSDGATEIGNKSDASENVTEANLSINTPVDFSGTADLVTDVDIDFGPTDIGIVEEVVIQNQTDGNLWVLGDETENPNLTGEEYTIETGTVLYELGNPTA